MFLNIIQLFGYTTFYLSNHQLNILVASSFCLLRIVLLWTFVPKDLCWHILSILLGKHLKAEMVSDSINNFWGTTRLLFKAGAPFYTPTISVMKVPVPPYPSTLFAGVFFFFFDHPSGRCEMLFHCGFDLHFLITNEVQF